MKKLTKLLIFPYNGNGLEAVGAVGKNFDLIGFIDDEVKKQGKQKNGLMVFTRNVRQKFTEAKVLAVPGSPDSYLKRKKIIAGLKIPAKRYATVIHPQTVVSPLAKIGYNVLIMAGAVITSNAVIGNHVCILPNSVIHHDVKIGEYSLIGSNVTIAGRVIIGKNCYVGSGSSIINDVEIGDNALVGMAANVICSVKPNTRVVGNPAREI